MFFDVVFELENAADELAFEGVDNGGASYLETVGPAD